MNFSKSSNLALWLIFLVLVAPYIFNNNFKSNFSIQNKSNKELKKDNKLQEQNELLRALLRTTKSNTSDMYSSA